MKFSADNNLDDKDLDKIKILVIDILSPPSAVLNNKNLKAFFTLLSFVEKIEEMIINFTNRSFTHSFIIIDNVSPNHISLANAACNISNTNLFIYIVND